MIKGKIDKVAAVEHLGKAVEKAVEKKYHGVPNFKPGHKYYPRNPEKRKEEKEEARLINPRVLKAIQAKALEGNEKAMSVLLSYELKKKELEIQEKQKFNPDDFLRAYDIALRERDDIIASTELTCIQNKQCSN